MQQKQYGQEFRCSGLLFLIWGWWSKKTNTTVFYFTSDWCSLASGNIQYSWVWIYPSACWRSSYLSRPDPAITLGTTLIYSSVGMVKVMLASALNPDNWKRRDNYSCLDSKLVKNVCEENIRPAFSQAEPGCYLLLLHDESFHFQVINTKYRNGCSSRKKKYKNGIKMILKNISSPIHWLYFYFTVVTDWRSYFMPPFICCDITY